MDDVDHAACLHELAASQGHEDRQGGAQETTECPCTRYGHPMREKGGLAALALLVACNTATTPTSPSSDAAMGDSARSPDGETQDATGGPGDAAAPDDAIPAHATSPADANGGPDARMPCDMDASLEASAIMCPPPSSQCSTEQQIVYFTRADCVAGWCSWQATYTNCPFGCVNGGCEAPPTM